MDYVKYALKAPEELTELLTDRDDLFLITCNKCFKEYNRVPEPESRELAALAEAMGRTVTGTWDVDFLCNAFRTEKGLEGRIPRGTKHVAVIACGLGIQTVADLTDLPVLAAADSLAYPGNHGMALTEKVCGACAQCYLNLTGGICPVVDCSKSLLNGQCGGAQDGRCEVDETRECAWENIRRRLEKQGRLEELRKQPIQIRDWSRVNVETIRDYVDKARAARFEGFYGGVHPEEKKNFTEGMPIRLLPEPERVILPLSMHVGAPSSPVVQVGDHVDVGQPVAEAAGFVSASIHSPVSGTVEAIEPHTHPNKGPGILSVVIRSDGRNTLHESVVPGKPLEELSPEEIVDIVRRKGITGLGGASFPTYVKLMPGRPLDMVLINGSECEPYLTADHRVMLEYADDVLYGLRAMMKAVSAPEGIIVIEDNKPDAIALLEEKTAGYENIRVCAAKTQYPEGAEKMLIRKVTGRWVPSGKLPADVGCLVCNTSTAKAVSDAIQRGMPVTRRVLTVSGEKMKSRGNYLVKLGTCIQDIIDFCGGTEGAVGEDVTVKMGGPMMGTELKDTRVPVLKCTNGIVALEADHREEQPCIRCGRCVDVCPMELEPLNLAQYAEAKNGRALLEAQATDCILCRCCDYICSSRIPLAAKINAGKGLVAALGKK